MMHRLQCFHIPARDGQGLIHAETKKESRRLPQIISNS